MILFCCCWKIFVFCCSCKCPVVVFWRSVRISQVQLNEKQCGTLCFVGECVSFFLANDCSTYQVDLFFSAQFSHYSGAIDFNNESRTLAVNFSRRVVFIFIVSLDVCKTGENHLSVFFSFFPQILSSRQKKFLEKTKISARMVLFYGYSSGHDYGPRFCWKNLPEFSAFCGISSETT